MVKRKYPYGRKLVHRPSFYKKRKLGYAAAGLYGASSLAGMAAGKLYNMFNSTSKEGPSSAITTQRDSMSLYRRKRAPKRVRRRAARRYKRFLTKQIKAKSDNTNLFDLEGSHTSAVGEQHMWSLTFGYLRQNAVVDDIGTWEDVYANYLNASPQNTSKAMYVTGIDYDITLSVTSQSVNVGGSANDSAFACEMDVYEYVFRRDKQEDSDSVANFISTTLAREDKLPGAAAKMVTTDLGVTPFDANQALKFIVIKNKQRYYIPSFQSVSFVKNVKFNNPIKLTSEDFDTTLGSANFMAKRGLTRGLIFVQKGTANDPDATNHGSVGSTSIRYNVQARYRFKVVDQEADQNAAGL